jgi:hypothetical protein
MGFVREDASAMPLFVLRRAVLWALWTVGVSDASH